MPVPGWYPDPADPTLLRYWSGSQWTSQVRPATPPPPAPQRGKWWPILAAGALLIVAALVAVWLFRPVPGSNADPGPSPTHPVWNESDAPTSSPTGAMSCSDRVDDVGIFAAVTDQRRLTVGHLSMPAPSGWAGPTSEHRLPYGRDGWAYRKTITTETRRGWASSASIGFTAFAGNPTVSKMSEAIAQCVSSSDYYAGVKVELASMKTVETKISGFDAAQTDVLLRIDDPNLNTKGSRLRIIVTRTSGPSQFFFSAVPMENAEHQAIIDKITQGLVAS